ncbi:MAG: hypothetical protein JNM77_08825 [Pseudonocardia sp.]|nr:hypothetical protein [Pseudonocardia sp.]
MPPRKRALAAVPAHKPGEIEQAVADTLSKLQLQPEDAGIRALALRYGRTIDDARKLADEAAALPYDPDTATLVARLKLKVDAHTVAVDVGPKLQAALDALGATPKARAVVGKPPPASGKSALALLRDEAGA